MSRHWPQFVLGCLLAGAGLAGAARGETPEFVGVNVTNAVSGPNGIPVPFKAVLPFKAFLPPNDKTKFYHLGDTFPGYPEVKIKDPTDPNGLGAAFIPNMKEDGTFGKLLDSIYHSGTAPPLAISPLTLPEPADGKAAGEPPRPMLLAWLTDRAESSPVVSALRQAIVSQDAKNASKNLPMLMTSAPPATP